jgi:hypothetical protein
MSDGIFLIAIENELKKINKTLERLAEAIEKLAEQK